MRLGISQDSNVPIYSQRYTAATARQPPVLERAGSGTTEEALHQSVRCKQQSTGLHPFICLGQSRDEFIKVWTQNPSIQYFQPDLNWIYIHCALAREQVRWWTAFSSHYTPHPFMPPICRAQREVFSANMRHEFVLYNNTNQDQQSDSLESSASLSGEKNWV